jgi:hypothetical protein
VFEPCATVDPVLQPVGEQHVAACHLYGVVGDEVERSAHPNRGEGGEDLLVADAART